MFNERRMFCKYIGSGSSRNVFDLGNGYVMKVAKNLAGIAQNKVWNIKFRQWIPRICLQGYAGLFKF